MWEMTVLSSVKRSAGQLLRTKLYAREQAWGLEGEDMGWVGVYILT